MKTNLVFKRIVNVEGHQQTEMKIIEVYIPELKSNEGWTLVSNADKVSCIELQKVKSVAQIEEEEAVKEFTEQYRVNKAKQKIEESLAPSTPKTETEGVLPRERTTPEYVDTQCEIVQDSYNNRAAKYDKITSVPSCCEGTACLIRVKDTIRISYRKGKQADYSTPNKVCIDNYYKQLFFNAVKKAKGTSTDVWSLSVGDTEYDWWNRFIDKTYQDQRKSYIDKLMKKEN